jgi:hypothetical protein
MHGHSQTYDRALAAGRLIYEQFVGDPHKADAGILGRLVFIIIDAMQGVEDEVTAVGVPPVQAEPSTVETNEQRQGDGFRFFCPKCLSGFKACAAHKHTIGRCPHCGAAIQAPASAIQN